LEELRLRLPGFSRRRARDGLVMAWDGQALAFVQAQREGPQQYRVQRFGMLRRGDDGPDAFARRLAGLGLKGQAARAMLRPAQYQILQIEAPAVPPEELRTAARWQIRDMVSQHVDDLTLDVLKVGDDQARAGGSLFVVAAANAQIREVMQTALALRCEVGVIDVHDLAQRNLQSALARRLGVGERAHAAIVMIDDSLALLTICANDELFYTRRIDLGAGFMQAPWGEPAGAGGAGEAELALAAPGQEGDRAQRLVVEVQRSLDLWDRTWPALVLDRIFVQAGARSDELARWLGQELGQAVLPLEVAALFPGFDGGSDEDRRLCWPLLGVLLRSEDRKL
jgi:MSHA biogenesis protein MshI